MALGELQAACYLSPVGQTRQGSKPIKGRSTRLHPEGYRFLAIFLLVSLALYWLWPPLGGVGLLASLWCAYFFRDPERLAPDIPGVLLAPADGVVLPLVKVVPPVELEMGEGPLYRISIFMDVFNVHVNRVPASGRIVKLTYVPGKFINASFDKASEFNERQLVSMDCEGGGKVGFVQIAGLVARRIVCHLEEGQEVTAGERFGLIRFGSRVDVYLTGAFEPAVGKGQKTTAGETVLARLRVADAV